MYEFLGRKASATKLMDLSPESYQFLTTNMKKGLAHYIFHKGYGHPMAEHVPACLLLKKDRIAHAVIRYAPMRLQECSDTIKNNPGAVTLAVQKDSRFTICSTIFEEDVVFIKSLYKTTHGFVCDARAPRL